MINLNNYDYQLPDDLIAREPAKPRDSARLFIYDTANDEIHFDRFYNLDRYLPEKSFLVLNNTKVLPARVTITKENGGKVVVLFLVNEIFKQDNYLLVKGLVDRKIILREKVFFDQKYSGLVIAQEKNIFTFKFYFSQEKLFSLLEKYGQMPLPLYIKKTALSEEKLRQSYQTVFAENRGSSAAPTASLHFTEAVFSKLQQKNIQKFFITLHVGLGTFAPINKQNLSEKKLHQEYYEIDPRQWSEITALKKKNVPLVAVGTTVARTLETVGLNNQLHGKTAIFIFPPYAFKYVDCLITNFHLPKTSLMLLVEAFLRQKKAKRSLIELYRTVIENRFRFYSFGDAMLIR